MKEEKPHEYLKYAKYTQSVALFAMLLSFLSDAHTFMKVSSLKEQGTQVVGTYTYANAIKQNHSGTLESVRASEREEHLSAAFWNGRKEKDPLQKIVYRLYMYMKFTRIYY